MRVRFLPVFLADETPFRRRIREKPLKADFLPAIDALAGGASQSLRIDTQGKLLGTEVMELNLPLDHTGNELLRAGGWRPMDQEPKHGTVDQNQKASAQRNDHPQST